MNNFIIFLDIDGVLVSYDDFKDYHEDGDHKFKQSAVESLNKIIDHYKADLCMISSWNVHYDNEKQYKDFLISRGIHVNELTIGQHCNRVEFIEKYVKDNNIEHYLIIDDESHKYFKNCMITGFPEYKRILQPNRYRCLDDFDFKHVTKNWDL